VNEVSCGATKFLKVAGLRIRGIAPAALAHRGPASPQVPLALEQPDHVHQRQTARQPGSLGALLPHPLFGNGRGTAAPHPHRPQPHPGATYSKELLSQIEKGYANSPLYVYVHLAVALDIEPGRLMGSDETQKPITEAEMTLIRVLRRAAIRPDEAIASLTARRFSD
jgi:transcriptional regulator with XRE-family HTH domain